MCPLMCGIMHRAFIAPLVALLVLQGGWCFCGIACDLQVESATAMATESLPGTCGCCSNRVADRTSQQDDSSCCGCCVEAPLAELPTGESFALGNTSLFLLDLHGKGQTIPSVHVAPARVAPFQRDLAQHGRHLYLRFEVLRV